MRIHVIVVLKDTSKLRNDIPYWDLYGCSEALDSEMTKFPLSNFYVPSSGHVARAGAYGWSVLIQSEIKTLSVPVYPTILFLDRDNNNKELGRIEGTPHYQGEVSNLLQKILSNTTTGTTGTSPSTKKATQAGLGILAFLLLFVKLKKAT